MLMYTDLDLRIFLKHKTPDEVVNILKKMTVVTDIRVYVKPLPDHPFFRLPNWWRLFDPVLSGYPDLRFVDLNKLYTIEEYTWHVLEVHMSIKNYRNEVELFLNWLSPYIDSSISSYLGAYRYEEWDTPRLIYIRDGVVCFEKVERAQCCKKLDQSWLENRAESP